MAWVTRSGRQSRQTIIGLLAGLMTSFGITTILTMPEAAQAAQEIQLPYGPLNFTISVSSIENFAKTGEIDAELRPYATVVGKNNLAQIREVLQRKFQMNQVAMSQLAYTGMGEYFLQNMGKAVQTETGDNGFFALRSALILASGDPRGMSLLDIIRRYPTRALRIKTEEILEIGRNLTTLLDYRDAAVTAIEAQAAQELASQTVPDFSQLEDLRQPGKNRFSKQTLTINSQSFAGTIVGKPVERNFPVDIYLPQLSQPAPIVVLSHGLGSQRKDLDWLAEHLSSHGFAVVVPEHIGSDKEAQDALLQGVFYGKLDAAEFVDRPRDVQLALDALQQNPAFSSRVNVNQVGIIGHSFGGYTTLAIAGAQLDLARLKAVCASSDVSLNLSLALQCRASELPSSGYTLADPRIKAAIALNPVSGSVFDPDGISKIQVPMMIIGGSEDFVTPAIPEQIHPYFWLKSSRRYLGIMKPAGHQSFYPQSATNPPNTLGKLLIGPDPVLGSEYVKAISLAMMQTYVARRSNYQTYLAAAYAKYLTRSPLSFDLVQSLTPAQVEQAFGKKPPIPVFPK